MRLARILVLGSLVATVAPAHANEADDDWRLFGGILSLVQSFVRIAASTDDPQAMQRGIDHMLSGRNADANRVAGQLMNEMFEDMPAQYRGTVSALARDVVTLARRENARTATEVDPVSLERAIQARKDLTAIGLRYHDASQFLEAVRRDDALAVELFIHGRGVNLAARDADGRTAVEIAKRAGNRQIVALLGAAGAKR